MKLQFLNDKGKSSEINIESNLWELPLNEKALAKYVRVYLTRQRSNNAESKGRSEVRGGGRKPWNQKGTGRARQGSIRAPHWKGGGVVFGPNNTRNYSLKINRKEGVIAFVTALKLRFAEQTIFVASLPEFSKTKEANNYLIDAKIEGSVTIISNNANNYKFLKSITNVKIKSTKDVSTYDLISTKKLIFTEDSLVEILKIKEIVFNHKS